VDFLFEGEVGFELRASTDLGTMRAVVGGEFTLDSARVGEAYVRVDRFTIGYAGAIGNFDGSFIGLPDFAGNRQVLQIKAIDRGLGGGLYAGFAAETTPAAMFGGGGFLPDIALAIGFANQFWGEAGATALYSFDADGWAIRAGAALDIGMFHVRTVAGYYDDILNYVEPALGAGVDGWAATLAGAIDITDTLTAAVTGSYLAPTGAPDWWLAAAGVEWTFTEHTSLAAEIGWQDSGGPAGLTLGTSISAFW
jgi:hypothetical protein